MIRIDWLFDFCDLHVSRWQTWPQWWVDSVHYFDKEGFPLPSAPGDEGSWGTLAWARLHEDREYARIARDDLPDGGHLSTVWLGLDHGHWPTNEPQVYETMRFSGAEEEIEILGRTRMIHPSIDFEDPRDGTRGDQLRYATKEEALAIHTEIVRRLRVREGH